MEIDVNSKNDTSHLEDGPPSDQAIFFFGEEICFGKERLATTVLNVKEEEVCFYIA